MAILPIGDLGLGNEFNDDNQAASLGRISGPLLKDNLERNGISLAFETDLLYIDVITNRIGIRKDNPAYDLDVNDEIITVRATITDEAIIENIIIRAPDIIGTLQGSLNLYATGADIVFEHDRMITSDLDFDQNSISSFDNADIILDPNGTGTVEFLKNTTIVGDLAVTGNITLDGDLSAGDNIIVGNETIDTVTLAANFDNALIPAADNIYSLGTTLIRWNDVYSNTIKNTSSAVIGNILIESPAGFRTNTGGITINATGVDPVTTFERLLSTQLIIDNNIIAGETDIDIRLNPNGTGSINLLKDTNVTGDLYVSGNISVSGNLATDGTITIGDQPIDTVDFNINFTQSIIPGENNVYSLGTNTLRWLDLYSDVGSTIENINTLQVVIDQQMLVDGVANKISATQLNEDILILPDTGITQIEETQWQDNDITNLLNTPITLSSTGIGYFNFSSTTAFVVPSGTTAEQRIDPEVGETRWNTTEQYLECWDGTVWNVAIGPQGETDVTVNSVEDLNYIWNLILG
jgi:cytoskeletal protein CcmA (bactofilin family)